MYIFFLIFCIILPQSLFRETTSHALGVSLFQAVSMEFTITTNTLKFRTCIIKHLSNAVILVATLAVACPVGSQFKVPFQDQFNILKINHEFSLVGHAFRQIRVIMVVVT